MAYQPGALAGTAYLTVDGVQYPVVSGVGYKVTRRDRETLAGMDGIHGWSEGWKAGYIKAVVRDMAQTRVAGFEAMESVSVSLELTSGKRISGNGMWTVGAHEVNSDDATIEVRFEGVDVVEN